MEKKIRDFIVVISICISFLFGWLVCSFFTEPETIVKISGAKLYYNKDGTNNRESINQNNNSVEKENIEKAYRIDLNKATKEELMDIPYIGEKTAEKIITYRNNLPFKTIEELLNVKTIDQKTYVKIKEYLYVEKGSK